MFLKETNITKRRKRKTENLEHPVNYVTGEIVSRRRRKSAKKDKEVEKKPSPFQRASCHVPVWSDDDDFA